jgi:hypothetical protein
MTADAGRTAGKPVGVCREAASDPLFAVVLTGLGVTSLSMAPPSLAEVRAALAERTLAECPGRRRGRAHRGHPRRRTRRRRRLTRTPQRAPSAGHVGEVNAPRGRTDRVDFGLTGVGLGCTSGRHHEGPWTRPNSPRTR